MQKVWLKQETHATFRSESVCWKICAVGKQRREDSIKLGVQVVKLRGCEWNVSTGYPLWVSAYFRTSRNAEPNRYERGRLSHTSSRPASGPMSNYLTLPHITMQPTIPFLFAFGSILRRRSYSTKSFQMTTSATNRSSWKIRPNLANLNFRLLLENMLQKLPLWLH